VDDKERKFTLKLESKEHKGDRVPVKVLVKTLDGIQKAVYELGNYRLNRDSTPGPKPFDLEKDCELYFVKAEQGSVLATVAFPERGYDLVPNLPDMTDYVYNDMKNVLTSIASKNRALFKDTVKDQRARKRIMNSLAPVLPSDKNKYDLLFTFDDGKKLQRIERPKSDEINEFIDFVELIDASQDDDLIEIKALCKAIVNENGKVEVREVLEFELLDDLKPYIIEKIEVNNKIFVLSQEIVCPVTREEDYIIIEYEPLGIESYAKTRDAAINSFNEEFAILYRVYLLEENENLTQDALKIKERLYELIDGVQQRIEM
jgi:hypothetical protein